MSMLSNKYRNWANSPLSFNWKGLEFKPSPEYRWSRLKGFKKEDKEIRKGCHDDCPSYRSLIDHSELYGYHVGPRQYKWIIVAHEYDVTEWNKERWQALADKYGMAFYILDIPSWYNEGCTVIVWEDKEVL